MLNTDTISSIFHSGVHSMASVDISSITRTVVLGGATVCVSTYLAYSYRPWYTVSDYLRGFISNVAMRGAERVVIKPEVLRAQFNDLELTDQVPVSNHTHSVSAAQRSTASTLVDAMCARLKLTPYYIQCSRADQRIGRAGSRSYYWTKDLQVESSPYEPPDDAMLTLIDVDYYIDMRSLLVGEFKPVLVYAFQPESVAKSDGECSYTFNEDNEVVYKVSGGASYQHPVWNYGSDNIFVVRKLLGIPVQAASYLVDRRKIGDDRYLICLTPVVRWRGIWALLSWFVSGYNLQRLEPCDSEFLRMEVMKSDGLYVSTGMTDRYVVSTIPAATDDTLNIIAKTSSNFTLASVRSHVDDVNEAAILFAYHRTHFKRKTPVVFPVEKAVRRYQITKIVDDDAPPSLTAFMAPIIHGAFAPDMCVENEKACIKGRIRDVKPAEIKITPFLNRAILEFTRLFMPKPSILHPVEADEVYLRQSRPSQRRILGTAGETKQPHLKIKSFMKKEAYTNPKDARPISTIDNLLKLKYSQFMYALSDYIKERNQECHQTLGWYAFGKTPKQVALTVSYILSEAQTAVNTDFSRFDGRVSNVLRELEHVLLVRAFSAEHVNLISELHRSQYNLVAVGRFRTKYDTGYARCSGSPETAAFNSLANAFVAYLAFRMTKDNSGYLSPQDAYSRLGIYGGDDGLTADINPDTYMKAAKMVGQKLTIEVVQRGNMGIKFLSRQYGPDVWFGDANSCCDIPRQLTKFHTTANMPSNVSSIKKLLEKARAYYLTDSETPIIGEMVSKIVQIHGEIPMDPIFELIRPWNSDLPKDVQYPNKLANWMRQYCIESLEPYNFSFAAYYEWLGRCTDLVSFLTPPLCAEIKEPEVTQRTVVDGEVFVSKSKSPSKEKKKTSKNQKEKKTSVKSKTSVLKTKTEQGSSNSKKKTSKPVKGGSASKN